MKRISCSTCNKRLMNCKKHSVVCLNRSDDVRKNFRRLLSENIYNISHPINRKPQYDIFFTIEKSFVGTSLS